MLETKRKTESTESAVTLFTADQQLCRVVVNITWVYPRLLEGFIPILRATHTLVNFVGCIGYVMAKTRLVKILEASFTGVSKLLSEKKNA